MQKLFKVLNNPKVLQFFSFACFFSILHDLHVYIVMLAQYATTLAWVKVPYVFAL